MDTGEIERDIETMLHRHRRRRWWPRRCRCGLRYPCGPRLVALDERLRLDVRAAQDAYPAWFAGEQTQLLALARLRNPGRWTR